MFSDWILRFRALVGRTSVEGDIDDELRFHFERQVEQHIERGLSRPDAVRQTQLEFGGFDQVKEEYRDALGVRLIEDFWRDLCFAVRILHSAPFVTTAAVLSLALGIGANTAIFSILNSLVFKSLPVSAPQRLFWLSAQPSPRSSRPSQFSYATFRLFRQRSDLFDGALGASSCCTESNVRIGGDQQIVESQFVTGDFFMTLGIQPIRGRLLTLADDEPGAPDGPVAVLSFDFWQRLGGRDDVIGSRLTMNGTLVSVIGVTPAGFRGLEVGRAVDLHIPQHLTSRMTASPFDEDTRSLNLLVRLKPGITQADATVALRAVQPHIRAESMPKNFSNPTKFLEDPFTLLPATTGLSELRQRFERPLIVIFVVVSLLLLIACLNVGNLLLARSVARQHELSLRVAIGASRWRLARQFLLESLVLSSAGAVAGLVLAVWMPRALLAYLSDMRGPILLDTPVDRHVLFFTLLAMVTTALLFGTLPAIRGTRVRPIEILKLRPHGVRRKSIGLATGLIAVQSTLSMMLVVGAGLFIQTFDRLSRVSLGFDRNRTLVAMVNAPTKPAGDRPIFFDRLAQRVSGEAGIEAAAGALSPPIIGLLAGDMVVSPPGTVPAPDAERVSEFDSITPRWFATYGITIERGRDFDEHDIRSSPPVMIVSRSFAQRLFPGRDVIGMPLMVTFRDPIGDVPLWTRTIVGVVADSVRRSVRDSATPTIYVPLAQREPIPQKELYLSVRSRGGSLASMERVVGAAITSFDRDVTFRMEPLSDQVDESLAQERVLAVISGFVGGLALLLAALGQYGLTAYSVAQRRSEIAIRIALGASSISVVRLAAARVMKLVVVGTIAGVVASLWFSRYIETLLFGLEPQDPRTLFGAALVLVAAALLAAVLAARKAVTIEPAAVLREI